MHFGQTRQVQDFPLGATGVHHSVRNGAVVSVENFVVLVVQARFGVYLGWLVCPARVNDVADVERVIQRGRVPVDGHLRAVIGDKGDAGRHLRARVSRVQWLVALRVGATPMQVLLACDLNFRLDFVQCAGVAFQSFTGNLQLRATRLV